MVINAKSNVGIPLNRFHGKGYNNLIIKHAHILYIKHYPVTSKTPLNITMGTFIIIHMHKRHSHKHSPVNLVIRQDRQESHWKIGS
jgi:hypothetical protein